MRITNQMMVNSTMANIQVNKKQVSGYTATGFTFPHLVYSFLFSAIRVMTRL